MAFKEIKAQEEVSPNLIPMIDIMFLLLLFFMLNADMSQRELEELTPPIATHAEVEEGKADANRITVNVHHDPDDKNDPKCPPFVAGEVCRNDVHWHISMSGRKYDLSKDGMTKLATALTELGKTNIEDPTKGISGRSLIIRADRTAPYMHVQKVMEAAGTARIYKVQVGAGRPKASMPQEPK